MKRRLLVPTLVLGAFFGLAVVSGRAEAANGVPDCEDGIDNDGDGLVDYPADPGCTGPTDPSEVNPTDMAGLADSGAGVLGDAGTDLSTGVQTPGNTTSPFMTGSGTTTGSATPVASSGGEEPARDVGCDVAGGRAPTLPYMLLVGIALWIVVLRRPHA